MPESPEPVRQEGAAVTEPSQDDARVHGRLTWARLNAYGILLALLAVLALADLTNPGGSELGRLAGDVPPGQTAWVAGFGLSGALLVYAFLRTDRIAETAALAILNVSLLVQTVVSFALLGWVGYSATRIAVLLIVLTCSAARASTLWSKHGVTVTIPPRGEKVR